MLPCDCLSRHCVVCLYHVLTKGYMAEIFTNYIYLCQNWLNFLVIYMDVFYICMYIQQSLEILSLSFGLQAVILEDRKKIYQSTCHFHLVRILEEIDRVLTASYCSKTYSKYETWRNVLSQTNKRGFINDSILLRHNIWTHCGPLTPYGSALAYVVTWCH